MSCTEGETSSRDGRLNGRRDGDDVDVRFYIYDERI